MYEIQCQFLSLSPFFTYVRLTMNFIGYHNEKTLHGFQGVFFVLPFICFYLRVFRSDRPRQSRASRSAFARGPHAPRPSRLRRRNRRSRRSFPYPVHSLAQAASSNKVSVSSVSSGFLSFSISTVWELFEKRYHRYKLIFARRFPAYTISAFPLSIERKHASKTFMTSLI